MVHRCGQLRIEIVLLIATLINRGDITVIRYIIDNQVINTIYVCLPSCLLIHRIYFLTILGIAFFITPSEWSFPSSWIQCHRTWSTPLSYYAIFMERWSWRWWMSYSNGKLVFYTITWRNQGKQPSFGFLGTFYDILEEIENAAKQNLDVQDNLEMIEANQSYPEEGVRLLEELRNLSVCLCKLWMMCRRRKMTWCILTSLFNFLYYLSWLLLLFVQKTTQSTKLLLQHSGNKKSK